MGKEEWHKRYKGWFIKYADFTEKEAQECLEAGMGEYDYEEDPEDAAQTEMSYWGN